MSTEIAATDELCAHCFDCLVMYFSNGSMPELPSPYDVCGVECPMFVTLHKVTRRGLQLRGCIGVLSPVPLTQINDYVYKSAFEDTRFEPLQQDELPHLEISFSVLTHFEPASNYLDWELDIHGIRINFVHDHRRYSGTYLPGVAQEQGWTKEEALVSLVQKSGYRGGGVNDEFLRKLEVVRYQSSKRSMSYEGYLKIKETSSSAPSSSRG